MRAQVSYFATFDAKRQPSQLLDWIKLILFDAALNWLVLLVDFAVGCLLLLLLPVTFVCALVFVCRPSTDCASNWLDRTHRLSGF